MFFRMVYKSGQIFLPFCQGSRVLSRTDRQTDIAIPRLHYMQRGNNTTVQSMYCNGCQG